MQFIYSTIECPSGTYRSLTDDRGTCLDCPMNTAMDVEGAAICSCLDEFFRDEQNNEGPEIYCTSEFKENSCISINLVLTVFKLR